MKKIGYFFFCFLPVLASFGLQFAAVFPIMGICLLQMCFSNFSSKTKMNYIEFLQQLTASLTKDPIPQLISILFAASGILIFGLWYACQFKGNLRLLPKKAKNPKLLIGLIMLVPGLQIFSSILTALSSALFPGQMDFYEKLMETAGFTGEPSLLLILYAVLLGPIEEELTFRGVIFASAQKAFPFWTANLFQAFLFGLFHLNLIQGIYAFMIGLFLGYVCGKGGSLWFSIFLHILFNFWGTLISTDNKLSSNPLHIVFFFLFSLLLGTAGLCLFHRTAAD